MFHDFLLFCGTLIASLSIGQAVRCYSCASDPVLNIPCQPTVIECQAPLDSCFTLTLRHWLPIVNVVTKYFKRCSQLSTCGDLDTLMCDNSSGHVDLCSVECCATELCNDDQLPPAHPVNHSLIQATTQSTAIRERMKSEEIFFTHASVLPTTAITTEKPSGSKVKGVVSGTCLSSQSFSSFSFGIYVIGLYSALFEKLV